jgi:hypothetical protein
MSLYVPFFITSNRKLNLEGSSAFKRVPPGRNKIWKRISFWLIRAASSSYEPPLLPPFPSQVPLLARFLRLLQQNYVLHCNYFLYYHYFIYLKNFLTNLFKKKIIFENNFAKLLN